MNLVKRGLFLLSVLFFLINQYSHAQSLSPFFKNYTTEDGLPSSEVYQIKQDKRGYIWFVTDNGISRFDGNQFENFTPANGLCVKTLFGIYEDNKDRIWFYSYSGEVIYFDYKDEKIHCPIFNKDLKLETRGKILNGLFIHKDTLIIFDYLGSEFKVTLDDQKVLAPNLNKGVLKLTSYGENKLVYGHRKNPNKQLYHPDRISYLDFENKDLKFSMPIKNLPHQGNLLSSALQINDSIYYFSLQKQLLRINIQKQTVNRIKLSHLGSQSLFLDHSKLLWIGLNNKGVYAFNTPNHELVHHFLDGYNVTYIFEDRDGGYWFSTQEAGVFYCPNLLIRSLRQDAVDKYNRKMKLLGNNDSLIFYKTNSNEISIFDNRTKVNKGSLTQLRRDQKIVGFYLISDQVLLFLNDRKTSFSHFSLKDFTPLGRVSMPNHIACVKEYSNGILVLDNNRAEFRLQKGKFENLKTIFSFNNSLNSSTKWTEITENGGCYIAHYNQLFYTDSTLKENLKPILLANSPDIIVSAIEPWKEDLVWISTQNAGVLLLDRDSIVLHIDKEAGLPLNNIAHVLYDQNHLYLSCRKGILKVNPWSKDLDVKEINMGNGLPSNEVSKCLRLKDKLYAETRKGICIIDTSIFYKTPTLPECVVDIEKFLAQNQFEDTIDIKLAHNFKALKVYFKAINFENAFQIPYRYRLEKTNSWTYTNNRDLTFSNLSSGSYHFEVQAAGATGIWGNSATLDFMVLKPLWQEIWFILLLLLFLAGILYLIYKYRINNIQKINNLKTSLIHQQNQALSAQINPHFIFNSLNSISNSVINSDVKTSVLYIGKFGKLMRKIFENSQETFINLTEELDALKTYLDLEKIRLKEKLNFNILVDDKIDKETTYLPALLLQPFVENAIWHGIAPKEANGKIEISISKEENSLFIQIKDDGIGIRKDINKKNENKKSALSLTLKRIELIKKLYKRDIRFEIKAIDGNNGVCGTLVLLTIPIIETKPN